MDIHRIQISLFFMLISMIMTSAGISAIHDFKDKLKPMMSVEKLLIGPYKIKNLDNTVFKISSNVTQNSKTEETLYQISKDLVTAILSKLEIQDKITRITREALEAPGKNKGMTAIETRRILDFISRTLSGHILSITRAQTEPELHRLVFGLSQIAAEVSIVAALKDITYATALSKKQSVDLSLRKKRDVESAPINKTADSPPLVVSPQTSLLLNKSLMAAAKENSTEDHHSAGKEIRKGLNSPYAIISRNEKKSVHILTQNHVARPSPKGFLNQTALDAENAERAAASTNNLNLTEPILMEKEIDSTHVVTADSQTLDNLEQFAPGLTDDWNEQKDNIYKSSLNPDVAADIEIEQTDNFDEDAANEKRAKQKLEKLELKAKKAILYAGDVAYLAAASVVAMRRALTASIEVQMSIKYAKNGLSNHQDLMMNLAKTAAQQAGKEARSATSKSLATERVIKLALKYTAQSHGATLNHVANRIVMDTLSLATLSKSMAFVSSEIAINSLYQATDVKPPS